MLIACIAEGSYWRHTGAMIHSLLTHNAQHRPEVVVLHGAGTAAPADRERMSSLVAGFGAPLRFLEVAPERIAAFPDRYFHRSIWYRAFLPELLPDRAKVLYLDSDLLVLDSLQELWDLELSSHPFAAVTNPLHPALQWYPRRALGLPLPEYFNSGVLLMNLKRLRAERAPERLLAHAQAHPEHTCPDQDALNLVFRHQRLALHPRWNLQTPLFDLPRRATPFEPLELDEALRRPAIVHFSGAFKPWHYLCRYPYTDRYFEHARQTPWPAVPVEGRTAFNGLLRRLPPDWIYRYFLITEYGL
jgi:lipopolysaccharide biosynthesis glycosyltransferase